MKRRKLLTVIGSSVVAGCTAGPASDQSTETRSTQQNETTQEQPETRLKIFSDTDTEYSYTFRLTEQETGSVVYDSTKAIGPNESLRLDDEFSPGVDYQLTIRHEGTDVFEQTIYSYEGYTLTIKSKTEIEVTRHVEI